MEKEMVNVEIYDLYQFLIGEMRYGYTRNNHLMPGDGYDKCKKYLPLMLKVNKSWAISTAKQLCDECISDELTRCFYSGDDDEFGNREGAINFIKWLLAWISDNGDSYYRPYNYDVYLRNTAFDDKPQYLISELFGYDIESNTYKEAKALNKDKLLSRNEYANYLFMDICGARKGETILYNKISLDKNNEHHGKMVKHYYHIYEPINRYFLIEKVEANNDDHQSNRRY